MSRNTIGTIFASLKDHAALEARFLAWEHYDRYQKAVDSLQYDVLYQSHLHGAGHIERVMILGALLAMQLSFDAADTQLVLLACAYHDTGRIDDSKDDAHGARSADKAANLTHLLGEELSIVRAAMCAHSVSDQRRCDVFRACRVCDADRAARVTDVLKDADALDRVRLCDLDTRYLRTAPAHDLVPFAHALFEAYQKGGES